MALCRFAILVLLSAVLLASSAPAYAQREVSARSRVIVQLRDDVPLEEFAAAFVPDERTSQSQAAYHSHSVLGAIMSLERQYGFRARAFYSRAIRGFATTLTRAQ